MRALCSLPGQHAQKNHIIDGPACSSTKKQKFFFRKYFNFFCGEPCVGFIMTKCYDGKNAKTNACGSGIQAPCCYAYAFSQFGQKLFELAFKYFYSSSLLLKMWFFFRSLPLIHTTVSDGGKITKSQINLLLKIIVVLVLV